jgi:CBS-domain-containing membrane protein
MADIQIRRLPVVDRNKRLVGIVALGDIATSGENECVADALAGISRPHTDGASMQSLA